MFIIIYQSLLVNICQGTPFEVSFYNVIKMINCIYSHMSLFYSQHTIFYPFEVISPLTSPAVL